ncbi:MAG: amidase domain-containing protein [Eubacteriales bacterium]
MLVTKPYLRERAVTYARKWALSRNPLFVDYTGRGGNCTNFVSQCLYAGSCTMNFTPIYGWYYLTESDRTASWTGVQFLFNFLINNTGSGPYGVQVGIDEAVPGDVIQLYREDQGWYHTMLIVGFNEDGVPLIAAQSDDALDRPLDTYTYDRERFIHILGVRLTVPDTGDCYDSLLNGVAIIPND